MFPASSFCVDPRVSCTTEDSPGFVVLAGTDLSVVFNETNTDFPAIDCARIHVDAIVRAPEKN